jgi:hypothetical protein
LLENQIRIPMAVFYPKGTDLCPRPIGLNCSAVVRIVEGRHELAVDSIRALLCARSFRRCAASHKPVSPWLNVRATQAAQTDASDRLAVHRPGEHTVSGIRRLVTLACSQTLNVGATGLLNGIHLDLPAALPALPVLCAAFKMTNRELDRPTVFDVFCGAQ